MSSSSRIVVALVIVFFIAVACLCIATKFSFVESSDRNEIAIETGWRLRRMAQVSEGLHASDIESIETIDDFAKRLSEITGVADDYDRFKFDAWATAYGFERRDEANILTIKIYCNNRHAFNASVLFVTIVFHRQAGDQSAEVIRGWDKAKKP